LPQPAVQKTSALSDKQRNALQSVVAELRELRALIKEDAE